MKRLSALAVMVFATSTASLSAASNVITLPLDWVDRQAYVASIPLDDAVTRLQVSTFFPYSWVACGLQTSAKDTCDPSRCDSGVYAETNHHCATQRAASLALKSPTGASLTTTSLALRIAQYHNLSLLNDTKVYTPPAMKPDYTAEQPRLVTGAQGELGLGRGTVAPLMPLASLLRSFSVFVTNNAQGSLLLLDVGPKDEESETFDPSLVIANEWTAKYTMPVRNVTTQDQDELLVSSQRWDLSLIGVRFDEDAPLYPRAYTSWADTPGGDAAAALSLNHAVIQLPSEMLKLFNDRYLSSCTYSRTTMGFLFFLCAASVRDTLPRITFYLGNHTFFLDPVDYTHVPPNNASAIAVEVSGSDDNTRWVLGAPFLRKFPARFGVVSNDVTLFCQGGTSCRPQSIGSMERQALGNTSTWKAATRGPSSSPTPSPSYTPYPTLYVIPTYTETSPVLLTAIWTGRCFAVMILVMILIRTVSSCRDRLLGRRHGQVPTVADDTGTVASERDLEEAKQELRRMVAQEEAERQVRGDMDEYGLIQSPRSVDSPHGRRV